MKKFYNPLNEIQPTAEVADCHTSTSSLLNDVVGVCPKCKLAFGTALVNGDSVYYCETCRVSQPIPK